MKLRNRNVNATFLRFVKVTWEPSDALRRLSQDALFAGQRAFFRGGPGVYQNRYSGFAEALLKRRWAERSWRSHLERGNAIHEALERRLRYGAPVPLRPEPEVMLREFAEAEKVWLKR